MLESLRTKPDVQVLIVGGGINGIGTFRELALNGIDTLLVDRGDFCSGASAASSHMAHGGIRYLENGEFALVREALRERDRLLRNAPHLVKPLPTTIPIFKDFSGLFNAPLKFLGLTDRPSERGGLVVWLGLQLYELLSDGRSVLPRHRFRNRRRSHERWPMLHPSVIRAVTYWDGAILSPERLAIEVLLDAEAAHPRAHAFNYMSLAGAQNGLVQLRDELTGASIEVRPAVVINATGAWIDACNARLGLQTQLIGGTKGSHIVLHHDVLRQCIGEHEFFFENADGRIVLILPLYDRVLVGTSDLPVSDPDLVECSEEEVVYFLELVRRVFPAVRVRQEEIVFRFAGVRPLEADGSTSAGRISRASKVHVFQPAEGGVRFPVYSLVGGKWTSFRALSARAAGLAMSQLRVPRKVRTEDLPIGGGRDFRPSPMKRGSGTSAAGEAANQASRLRERYGTHADEVGRYLAAAADRPLRDAPEFTRREIQFLAAREKVVHLDDVLLRRTVLAILGRVTGCNLRECAEAVGEALGWSADKQKEEYARTRDILERRHGVRLEGEW